MKTHYGQCDKATESHNFEYWSIAACGLDADVPMTENTKEVTCKKCIKKLENGNSKTIFREKN